MSLKTLAHILLVEEEEKGKGNSAANNTLDFRTILLSEVSVMESVVGQFQTVCTPAGSGGSTTAAAQTSLQHPPASPPPAAAATTQIILVSDIPNRNDINDELCDNKNEENIINKS
jgi:hypothetical protein